MTRLGRLIERAGIPLTVMARDAGLNRASLHGWSYGLRRPLPESIEQLARGLEHRSSVLAEVAERIRKEIQP